ncbi:hypothetical protein [Micromonospora echinaurantiaca]|uniref:hypothetical protein n=1 Tax=Micromonospora echinaurantiaca TaxID=47857 RepID=UPI001E3B4B7A|nr:hypothetical protein [Micromonospora echinaurantiaca]
MDVRAGRCRRAGVRDDGVVAQPAQGSLEELDPVEVVPDVEVELAAGTGKREQLTEVALVEAGQRVGLQPGGTLWHHRDHGTVGVELDGDRRHHQRVLHPVPADVGAEDAVSPHQLVRGRVHVDAVLQVEQAPVQLPCRLRTPGLVGPRTPLSLPPLCEPFLEPLGRLLVGGEPGFGGVRRRAGHVRRELARRPDRLRRSRQADPQPTGAVGGDTHLAGGVVREVVLPEGVDRGHRPGRLLHLGPHGHQVLDQGGGPVEDQPGRFRRGCGGGEHAAPLVLGWICHREVGSTRRQEGRPTLPDRKAPRWRESGMAARATHRSP